MDLFKLCNYAKKLSYFLITSIGIIIILCKRAKKKVICHFSPLSACAKAKKVTDAGGREMQKAARAGEFANLQQTLSSGGDVVERGRPKGHTAKNSTHTHSTSLGQYFTHILCTFFAFSLLIQWKTDICIRLIEASKSHGRIIF